MNTSALITMIATWTVVISFTGYFFVKVLIGRKPDANENSVSDEEPKE